MLKVLRFVVCICFAAITACAYANGQELQELYSTGEPIAKPAAISGFVELKKAYSVPKLDLYYLDGQKVDLAKYKNKLLVLEAWATWCGICLQEMPSLIQLQEKLKGTNIEFVGVNIDVRTDAVEPFLKKMRMAGFNTWSDPTQSLGKIMPLAIVPSAYVFDGNGNLIGLLRGYVPWNSPQILSYLEKLAAKYSKPAMETNAGK